MIRLVQNRLSREIAVAARFIFGFPEHDRLANAKFII
jgi:hypothetical protein